MAKSGNSQNQYSPVFANINWQNNNEKENEKDRSLWFEQFFALPVWLRLGLIDLDVDQAVKEAVIKVIGQEDPQWGGVVSGIIRDYFLGKVSQSEIKQRLTEKAELSEEKANLAEKEIQRIISLIKTIGKEKEAKSLDKLPIILALKKYEEVGKQIISTNFIKLNSHNSPVAPTIKNWLEDYIQKMGAQSHTSLERSEYLFNSENGKGLDNESRSKLSIILESYDKDKDLVIDKEEKKIIFNSEENSDFSKKEKKIKGAVKANLFPKNNEEEENKNKTDKAIDITKDTIKNNFEKTKKEESVNTKKENINFKLQPKEINFNEKKEKIDSNNLLLSKQKNVFFSGNKASNEEIKEKGKKFESNVNKKDFSFQKNSFSEPKREKESENTKEDFSNRGIVFGKKGNDLTKIAPSFQSNDIAFSQKKEGKQLQTNSSLLNLKNSVKTQKLKTKNVLNLKELLGKEEDDSALV